MAGPVVAGWASYSGSRCRSRLSLAASGALVAHVEEKGSAKAAGIRAGDVILKFNDRDVGSMRELQGLLPRQPERGCAGGALHGGVRVRQISVNSKKPRKQSCLPVGKAAADGDIETCGNLGLELSSIRRISGKVLTWRRSQGCRGDRSRSERAFRSRLAAR